MSQTSGLTSDVNILDAFRANYVAFERLVVEAMINPTDSTVLARLGDDLDTYLVLVNKVCLLSIVSTKLKSTILQNMHIFDATELATVCSNLSMMQTDVRLQYQQTLDESHHGRPTIIEPVYAGNRGCSHLEINPDFLWWAYTL